MYINLLNSGKILTFHTCATTLLLQKNAQTTTLADDANITNDANDDDDFANRLLFVFRFCYLSFI